MFAQILFFVSFVYLAYEDLRFHCVSGFGLFCFMSSMFLMQTHEKPEILIFFLFFITLHAIVSQRKWYFADLVLLFGVLNKEKLEVFLKISLIATCFSFYLKDKKNQVPLYSCFFLAWLSVSLFSF